MNFAPVPMLATPLELDRVVEYLTWPLYVMEQKLDGHRLICRWGPDGLVATTRHGNRYTKALPKALSSDLVEAIFEGFTLDGELVGDRYYAFDMLQTPNKPDLWRYPLQIRRDNLDILGAVTSDSRPFSIVPQAVTQKEKQALLDRAIAENLEGVVLKAKNEPYWPGFRSPTWKKAKLVETADVVVGGVREDGKESATLYAVKDGELVEVGRCSLIGKPAVKIGDVVEVKYLYASMASGTPRLYQPTLMRVRSDKYPHECSIDQLKLVNKQVLQDF